MKTPDKIQARIDYLGRFVNSKEMWSEPRIDQITNELDFLSDLTKNISYDCLGSVWDGSAIIGRFWEQENDNR
jgi:hypothetical protein